MIVRTIEMLLEYISIMLCIHKMSKEKFKINIWMILILALEWMMMILVENDSASVIKRIFIYFCLLLYTKYKITRSWKKTTKIIILMTITITTLQLLFLFLISRYLRDVEYIGTLVNVFIVLIIGGWRDRYRIILTRLSQKINGLLFITVLYVGLLIRLLYLCNEKGIIRFEGSPQVWLEIVLLSMLFGLFLMEHSKSKNKAKELQMYQLYNQAFEDTISTIRIRQHEFDNHINAIKCMKYTIKSQEELLLAQEQYCNDILAESNIGKLLRLKLEPVLVGFLYAKFTTAEEIGINVEYKIDSINISGRIKVYEIIELIGILFDNAFDVLKDDVNKKIIFKLLKRENGFVLEIANVSRNYSNCELEQFCVKGYSTKGKDHGIGLTRVKEITKKTNTELLIQNEMYNEENYLSFKVFF